MEEAEKIEKGGVRVHVCESVYISHLLNLTEIPKIRILYSVRLFVRSFARSIFDKLLTPHLFFFTAMRVCEYSGMVMVKTVLIHIYTFFEHFLW